MSTKFNTNKNNSPSRPNANKSPRKTGFGYNASQHHFLPKNFGKKSPNFGKLKFIPGPATIYAMENNLI